MSDGLPPSVRHDGPRPPSRPKKPADVQIAVGNDPTPPGRGWVLEDYNRDEDTGIARFLFQRYAWDPDVRAHRAVSRARMVVEQPQPSKPHHVGWNDKPPIDREAVHQRVFDSRLVNDAMYALGAYAR